MAQYASISRVYCSVQNDEDRERSSVVETQNATLFEGENPKHRGVIDLAMGSTGLRHLCGTCRQQGKDCPGHDGSYTMKASVVLPLFIEDSRRWFIVTCYACGAPTVDPTSSKLLSVPEERRLLVAASSVNKNEVRVCAHCGREQPQYINSVDDHFTMLISMRGRQTVLWPDQMLSIYNRISDEVVVAFGRPVASHPRNLICRVLKIPPVTIRPTVPNINPSDKSQSYHDINNIFQMVVRINDRLPYPIPYDNMTDEVAANLTLLQQAIYDLHRGSAKKGGDKLALTFGGRPIASIATRLMGKKGRFRRDLLGARVNNIGRTTLSGKNTIPFDSIGLSQNFAQILQVADTVQDYNIEFLMPFFRNGRRRYPGSTQIFRKATQSMHDVSRMTQHQLEIGDVLYRDLIDGDAVVINRQPTLERSSIGVHKAIIMPLGVLTMQKNTGVCICYGSDFDGDESNVFALARPGPRVEALILSSVTNHVVSTKNSVPIIGTVQDSTIGSMRMTRAAVRMNRRTFLSLFQDTTTAPPDLSEYPPEYLFTGWDAVSMLLRRYPISYERKPGFITDIGELYLQYDPQERLTVIKHGKMLSGVLDKKSVGQGANGGIVHKIARQYGTDAAMRFTFDLQQMAAQFLKIEGCSISVADLILTPEALAKIEAHVQGVLTESEKINQALVNGELIPPLDMTMLEYYEKQQTSILQIPDSVYAEILQDIDPETNGLHMLIVSGSKGKRQNQIGITSVVGQQTVDAKRITPGPSGRTIATMARGELNAQAYGFVPTGYIGGINTSSFAFCAMNGRFDLTTKALSTSLTGQQNREAICANQSMVTGPLRGVVSPYVVQPLYGGDGLDARRVQQGIKYRPAFLSDADLKEQYMGISADEFALIRADRDKYRDVFLKVERCTTSESFSDSVTAPIDVETFLRPYHGETAPDDADLEVSRKLVAKFCEEIVYVYLNSRQKSLRGAAGRYFASATSLTCMLVRAVCCTAKLRANNVSAADLAIALADIESAYRRSLICPGESVGILAAQAVSEPLTQYMLDSHHRSVTGGTSKEGAVLRPKEIFSAKKLCDEKSPSMTMDVVRPDGQYENDMTVMRDIANHIMLLTMRSLLNSWALLYEEFPTSTEANMHPDFRRDIKWIREFAQNNPLLSVPLNVTEWCYRIELNRGDMILKKTTLEEIINALHIALPHTYIVATPESAPGIVLRVYLLQSVADRKVLTEEFARGYITVLMDAPLRGLTGVSDARVVTTIRHFIAPDGSVQQHAKHLSIQTSGSNLSGLATYSIFTNIVTSSVDEVERHLGIASCRQHIVHEIRNVMGDKVSNLRHLLPYGDQMVHTGRVMPLHKSGITVREYDNIFLRMALGAPTAVLKNAALEGLTAPVGGFAGSLIMGGIPKRGTAYYDFMLDHDFVSSNITSIDQQFDSLI